MLRQIPNLITFFRILLIAPIAVALLHHEQLIALGLFFLAAASDLVDGFIAKRYGWQSAVGGVLDPAADKLLLATSFVVLAVMDLVPLWLMATAVARDLIIVGGALAYRLWLGPVEARPSNLSKLNTLCQALFIVCVIARQQFSQPEPWAIVTLGALTFLTTAVSGIDYVLRYGKAALEEARSRRILEHKLTLR
jgi:cardiolipin synthase